MKLFWFFYLPYTCTDWLSPLQLTVPIGQIRFDQLRLLTNMTEALLAIEMIYLLKRWKYQINNKTSANLGPCDFFIQFWRHKPLWSRMMQQGINSFFRGFKWVPHTSYTIHGQIFINFSITCLLVIHWLWMGDLYTQTTDGYNIIKSSTAFF